MWSTQYCTHRERETSSKCTYGFLQARWCVCFCYFGCVMQKALLQARTSVKKTVSTRVAKVYNGSQCNASATYGPSPTLSRQQEHVSYVNAKQLGAHHVKGTNKPIRYMKHTNHKCYLTATAPEVSFDISSIDVRPHTARLASMRRKLGALFVVMDQQHRSTVS